MVRLLGTLLLGVYLVAAPAGGTSAGASGTALVLNIDGAIGPATADYVTHGLDGARRKGASALILKVNTPGGLDPSMRQIVAAALASPLPVLCLVAPSGARAASAGTFILYGCAVAAMAPGTTIGAATPVALGGNDKAGAEKDAHAAKAINDAAAYIRGLAELHGRNAAWAEKAVREAATLTAAEAVKDNVVDFLADSLGDLLAKSDGRRAIVAGRTVSLATAGLTTEPLPPPWHNRLLAILTNPEVAYLLLLVGIYGVVFEMMAPGNVLPGLVGGLSLLVALYALNLLPLNYAGVGLLLLGVALMAAEPFVISHGALGIGGAVAFAVGSMMMFGASQPGFTLPSWVVVGGTMGSLLVLVWMVGVAVAARRRRKMSGAEALLSAEATVVDWLGDSGHIHLSGEEWQAHSTAPLVPGATVEVTDRHGLILEVAPRRRTHHGSKGA